jgi:hypothetical protein
LIKIPKVITKIEKSIAIFPIDFPFFADTQVTINLLPPVEPPAIYTRPTPTP